jgi:hypothetical protein
VEKVDGQIELRAVAALFGRGYPGIGAAKGRRRRTAQSNTERI